MFIIDGFTIAGVLMVVVMVGITVTLCKTQGCGV